MLVIIIYAKHILPVCMCWVTTFM